ncbi:MAG: hypothetical protein GXP37_05175 [Chloroflexi bacterium]|nr:hypothetical protein [Chloroflexota bacterium]
MRLHTSSVAIDVVTIIGILVMNSCAFPLPIVDTRVRPAVSDNSLLTGEPCLPPCWYNILPGSTQTIEAIEKVRKLEFVNPISIERTSRAVYTGTDDAIRWNYQGTNDFGGGIYIADDIVKWLRVSHPNYLALEDVILTIGEPDWVWAGRAGGAGNHYIYRFVYEEEGIMLESRMYGDNSQMPKSIIVVPDIEISEAFYFASRTLAQYLVEIRGVSDAELENIMSDYQNWPGYGAKIRTQKEYPRTAH